MRNYFLRIKEWFSNTERLTYATIKWLLRRKLWSIILIPILIIPAFFLSPKPFAFYSIILQCIGAIIIIWGADKRLKSNKSGGLIWNIKNDFSKFPPAQKRKDAVVTFEGDTVKISVSSNFGNVYATEHKDSFKEISEVVEYFNNHITSLHKRIGDDNKALWKEILSHSNSLSASQNENKDEIHKIKRILEENSTADVYLDVFGATCLIIGLILSAVQQLLSL